MPCYHPITAFARTPPGSTKKEIVFPLADGLDHMWSNGHLYNEKLKLPCGQCLGCRLEYSRQWAMRCFFEAKQWQHNYFVTLTYNGEHVPIKPRSIDPDTGEVLDPTPVMTLVKDDVRAFVKRLREMFRHKYGHTGIRFYLCGEYGPLHSRPHYHLILFNCPLPDLELWNNNNGNSFYISKIIDRAWSVARKDEEGKPICDEEGKPIFDNLGFSLVSDFTFETAAYVARYMLKKHKGKDAKFYEEAGIQPEFTLCSRRPGLAYEYFDNNKHHIYNFDEVVLNKGSGKVLRCQPPKYFDRLFDIDNPDELAIIKDKRKRVAERSMSKQLSNTDVPEQQYLCVKENNKALSIQSLKRSL